MPEIAADTAERLAKLLPRLASEHDGEVVATARAIGRVLTAASLDWHALSVILTNGSQNEGPGSAEWWARYWESSQRTKPTPQTAPDAPDAPSRKDGYPVWGTCRIEPWSVVAQHCLDLDWTIPKSAGGKFLTKRERDRLKNFNKAWGGITNAEADWIEATIVRCHAARERWRSPSRAAA